jgi:hypothetical protein
MRFILKVFKDSWCLDSGLLGRCLKHFYCGISAIFFFLLSATLDEVHLEVAVMLAWSGNL